MTDVYEDDVNVFYCNRCNKFLITEFDDTEPRACTCTNKFGAGEQRHLLRCDDMILRRNLENALAQLDTLVAKRCEE